MSHASHQEHEQARREQRHADMRDAPEEAASPRTGRSGSKDDQSVKGTAPAAPPRHEDEAFRVFEGNSPQSDG